MFHPNLNPAADLFYPQPAGGQKFRKDLFRSKRKPVGEIWRGEPVEGVTEIVRFAPSACNTQPWLVEREGDTLRVYRVRKPGRSGIMPAGQVAFYNQIDLGIFCAFWTSAFSGVTSDTRRSCTRTPVRTGKRRWPRSINGSGTE